jgi:hypothetical protein
MLYHHFVNWRYFALRESLLQGCTKKMNENNWALTKTQILLASALFTLKITQNPTITSLNLKFNCSHDEKKRFHRVNKG